MTLAEGAKFGCEPILLEYRTRSASSMPQHRIGVVNRLVPQRGSAQAIVSVRESDREPLVESLQLIENFGPREQARERYGRHLPTGQQAAVLTGVAARDPVPERRTTKGVSGPSVRSDDQAPAVHGVPAIEQQGPHHADVGTLSIGHHVLEPTGLQRLDLG